MEICIFLIANWQKKKVWYPHIIILILISLVMTPVFSLEAASIPVEMNTSLLSSNRVGPLVSMETQTSSDVINSDGDDNSNSPNYDLEPHEYDYENSDDDDDDGEFWNGVEEVDLTLPPFNEALEEEDLGDLLFLNESMFLDIDCEVFLEMEPPPKWENLPPPPLPPELENIKHLLQNINHDEDNVISLKNEEKEEECHLCKWATGGNQTLNYLAKKQSEESWSLTKSMIGSLIGVAFVSATLGAALMSFLLKCKRGDTQSTCVRGTCPVLVLRRRYPKSTPEATPEDSSETEVRSPTQSTKSESSSGVGWSLKKWRRSSSQAPLHLCSSPGSENSYVEEQYINCDANSAVYTELNPEGRFPSQDSTLGVPTGVSLAHSYSEIPDYTRPTQTNIYQRDPKCVNGGYISSETPPDRNDSSAGSTSTPSSAYYSDVSSCDIAAISKSRTRTRDNERLKLGNNLTTQYNVSSISNHVEFRPVHLNVNVVKSQHNPPSGPLPLSLQLLPKQLNTDRIMEGVPSVSLQHHHRRNALHLPHNHVLNNVNGLSEMSNNVLVHSPPTAFSPCGQYEGSPCGHYEASPCGHYETSPCRHYETTPCGHYEGIYEDDLMVIGHCNGISAKRPLPPLPSRRLNGPKRKRFNVQFDHELPSLTSNYV